MNDKIRFALVGSGWRAEFYARIARELPDQFELTGTWHHSPEKGEAWQRRFGGRVAARPEELLQDRPDFLVLSLTKPAIPEMLSELMDLEIPVLCETPPFTDLETGLQLWETACRKKAVIQVAEQYQDWPVCQAWKRIIEEGLIGKVSNMSISMVHSYHAASLIRFLLDTGFQNMKISGRRFYFPVQASESRGGIILNGKTEPAVRDRVTCEFEDGKVAFFDFGGIQYHTFIRTRHVNIQGDRGEIDDLTLRYLNAETLPITDRLVRRDFGPYNNNPMSHFGIMLGDRYLYRNPFSYARLNDDEIAIATCLVRMKRMLEGEKTEAYSLARAMQDAYIALEMEKALASPGITIQTETQPWARPGQHAAGQVDDLSYPALF